MSLGSAARTSTVQFSMGQLAVAGLGAFYIANPDKFFSTLQKGAFLLADSSRLPNSQQHQQQHGPIIIHQGVAGSKSGSYVTLVIQLVAGAGVCWGSYVVLTNILPEAAKGLLPVTNNVFSKAVSSLGRAVVHLKDAMMEQVLGLSQKQDELNEKQNETHGEVLTVKDNVADLKGDLGLVQESLDLCHSSLSESERRTSYIARGVQLLTRSVSSVLPENDKLMRELVQFSTEGQEFRQGEPLDQLQDVLTTMHSRSPDENEEKPKPRELTYENKAGCVSPENEVPKTPADMERSILPVKDLLESVRCYQGAGRVYG